MPYTKVDWDEALPITAARLDQMDQGIADAFDELVHRQGGDTMEGPLAVTGDADLSARIRINRGTMSFRITEVSNGVVLDFLDDGSVINRVSIREDGSVWQGPGSSSGVLARLARVVSGTYTGNNGSNRVISLPFDPVFVYLTGSGDTNAVFFSGLAGTAHGAFIRSGAGNTNIGATGGTRPAPTTGGFIVSTASSSLGTNESGATYRYFAIG